MGRGTIVRAAALLAVDRRHLYRLLRYREITPTATESETDVKVKVTLDLPAAVKGWLEREALRWKQEGRSTRMAISPIVVELVKREMAVRP
jgi:hypothetical protein